MSKLTADIIAIGATVIALLIGFNPVGILFTAIIGYGVGYYWERCRPHIKNTINNKKSTIK